MAYQRYIFINGRRYDRKIQSCEFTWSRDNGCEGGKLFIPAAPFDDFANIEIGDRVDIRYSSSSAQRWYSGYVAELETELPTGLTVTLAGLYKYLARVRPTGRFGTKVETQAPTDFAAADEATGGSIAAGTYRYEITSLDAEGETGLGTTPSPGLATYIDVVLAGSTSKVTLTWAEAQGATGYRVYRKLSTDANWFYWDVSELTFVDDGTSTGTDLGTGNTPNTVSTATTPTIAGTNVDDVVNHLLDTWLPDTVTKGTVSAGADTPVDDYDLTDSQASLLDVLKALADIVGNTITGVDEDGAVYFIPEVHPDTDTYDYQFRLGKYTSSVGYLESLRRRKTEDSFAFVKPEGEDTLDNEQENTGGVTPDDMANDAVNYPNFTSYNIAALFRGYIAKVRTVGGIRLYMSVTSIFHGLIAFGSVANFPRLTTQTKYFFLNGDDTLKTPQDSVDGATLEKWFYFQPGLFWLYTQLKDATLISDAFIARYLKNIADQIDYVKATRNDTLADVTEYDSGGVGKTPIRMGSTERGKVLTKFLPGVKTSRLAGQAAMNEMVRYTPTPEHWSATFRKLEVLLKPGQHLIRFKTLKGKTYDRQLQSISYQFGDSISASATLGQPEFTPEDEIETVKRTVEKLSLRRPVSTVWRPNDVYV